ncbi:hypothetical protein L596_009836 [Steinernema carpocapsae]|uniref:Uncharacterized protein n=1 Tax=Steinernema carpocapsae TaxID=34508 RepID=A0A4U5PHU2_STECR|nr:hypothetical protein L596_009836 [Steinernema carpocapsae]
MKENASRVESVSQANAEGITAMHNAICAGHYEIVNSSSNRTPTSMLLTRMAGRLFTARLPATTTPW